MCFKFFLMVISDMMKLVRFMYIGMKCLVFLSGVLVLKISFCVFMKIK